MAHCQYSTRKVLMIRTTLRNIFPAGILFLFFTCLRGFSFLGPFDFISPSFMFFPKKNSLHCNRQSSSYRISALPMPIHLNRRYGTLVSASIVKGANNNHRRMNPSTQPVMIRKLITP